MTMLLIYEDTNPIGVTFNENDSRKLEDLKNIVYVSKIIKESDLLFVDLLF